MELQQEVARRAVADAGEREWDRITLSYVDVDVVSTLDLQVHLGEKAERLTRFTCDDPYHELRAAMATPEHGTWYSSTCEITEDGRFRFHFEQEERPVLGGGVPVTDESLIADQERFPRPADELPAWHPARA